MSRRSRQWMAVPVLVLLAALLAWGCGGGEEVTTTTAGGTVTPTVSPGTTAGTDYLLNTQVKATESTPREYVEAIDQGHPVVLLFYVSDGIDDAKVLKSIDRLQSGFSGYVFLLYDYKTPEAYGDLSTLLKVNYPPELVLIDGTGIIRDIWNGYIDEGTLNQRLVDLGQG
jgi:hypothetical protein